MTQAGRIALFKTIIKHLKGNKRNESGVFD